VKQRATRTNIKSNQVIKKIDGLQNIITGLNRKRKDKRVNVVAVPDLLTQQETEDLYAADDTARKIIERLPREGIRKWIEITNANPEIKIAFQKEFNRLNATKKFERAWRWARLYGGAGIYLNIDDGEDPDMPVNFSSAKSIKTLIVLHRYELIAESQTIEKDIDSANFGMPTLYRVHRQDTNQTTLIHHERILRFEGAELPLNLFIRNGYWHDSVLSSLKSAIINYSQTHDNLASIFQDFRHRVMKIDQFAQMIAADEDDLLIKRMEIQDLIRSNFKTDMIDKEDELDIISSPLTGIKDTVTMVNSRLVGASNFPHTILLGESPKGGLSDRGESQNRDWYDYVSEEQHAVLHQPLKTLFETLMKVKEGPTQGQFLKDLSFEFLSLWQMSDEQRAKTELDVAKKDEVYIQNQVLTPEEVAISRWGADKFSMDTKIESIDMRKNLEAPENMESEETQVT
jgi:phage-related protein (TIGR01555 family)